MSGETEKEKVAINEIRDEGKGGFLCKDRETIYKRIRQEIERGLQCTLTSLLTHTHTHTK